MKIHIIRHAEAIERSPDIPEEHRYLTCRGRSRFRRVAKRLKKLGIAPDIILTSPLIRAVQTADILAEVLSHTGSVIVTPLLSPGFHLKHLQEVLRTHSGAGEIALVGHEPDLGEVVRALMETEVPCSVKKGGVVSFSLTNGKGTNAVEFLWLLDGKGNVITTRNKALAYLQKG